MILQENSFGVLYLAAINPGRSVIKMYIDEMVLKLIKILVDKWASIPFTNVSLATFFC